MVIFVRHFHAVIKEGIRDKKCQAMGQVISIVGVYLWRKNKKRFGPNLMVIK